MNIQRINEADSDITFFVMGYPVREVIAMAEEIRRGGYDPNSPDWNAYKAGYLQGRTDATKEINKRLTETFRDHMGRD